MEHKPVQKIFKLGFGVALLGVIAALSFLMNSSSAVRAQEGWTETPAGAASLTETPSETLGIVLPVTDTPVTPIPTDTPASAPNINETSTLVSTDYYSVESLSLPDGNVIQEMIIHGPPVPPPGYEIQRQSVSVPEILSAAGSNILTVPAYPWIYGCSAVSGAMIAGYYDRSGYVNIYTGSTNGGVMPLVDDSSWGTWVDNPPAPGGDFAYYNNPLIASKLGLDGRITRGSIDDYWVQYKSSAPDPYITGNWIQHVWGDAIGDYMRTSQSNYNGSTTYGLSDAYTRFYDNNSTPAAPLTCDTIASYVQNGYPPDGTLGRKQFYEARGYAVTDCYNQYTDNQYAGGFSYNQFKAEIDAGRPVMINLEGHTIVGVGYADPNTIYIHDTWDSATHSMTWGGSYSGMAMVSVSIVNLAPSNYSVLHVIPAGTGNGSVTSSPAGINCGNSCTYAFDKTTSVVLTAVPFGTSTFTGWSGGGCSGTGTCTVPMSSAQSVTATFSLPDLSITSLTILPSSPFTSDDLNVSVNVANLGGGSATTFRLEVYVDDVWHSCWYLGTPPEYFARVASLAANSTGTWSVTIPGGTLAAGVHTISAYVDMGCEVVEGNESNNSFGPVSVTLTVPLGGAFNLSSPANAAINQPANPTLQWGSSSGATSYEYCINTASSCVSPAAWMSTGTAASVALSGLTPGSTYFWQVRARNSSGVTYANGGSATTGWFSFTVLPLPGAFNKSSPANAAVNQPVNPTLSWSASANVSSYSYCIDTTNDSACSASWISTSTNTSIALSNLTPGVAYYWQSRADNAVGTTYGNGSSTAWWSFTVIQIPGAFNKISPIDAAPIQPANPVLSWGSSAGAASYLVCINTSASCSAPASWTSTGSNTSVSLTGLTPGKYYWQVQAVNSSGIPTNANSGAWWSFTFKVKTTFNDYDGDGRTDPAKFDTATGMLSYLSSKTGAWVNVFMGSDSYSIVPGSDFDGDGRTDAAKFVPAANAIWYLASSTGTWQGIYMGPGTFTLVNGGDYDGDGKTDPARFNSIGNALWYLASSTGTWQGIYMGPGTYQMVPASDFDGDGKTDPAEFSSSTNALWYLSSRLGSWQGIYMGPGSYQIVPASDFDGDGKMDPALFDTSSKSLWYLQSSTGAWKGVYMGAGTYSYISGCDFDGDGKTDPALFMPGTNTLWYLKSSTETWVGVYMGSGTYKMVN